MYNHDIETKYVCVEIPDPEHKNQWKRATFELKTSARNNLYFKVKDKVYVFKRKTENCPIFTVAESSGKWVRCGRWTGTVAFLGDLDELSYDEYLKTPEGLAEAKALWNRYVKDVAVPSPLKLTKEKIRLVQ